MERTVETKGVRLSLTESGDRSNPTVLLLHGYPDTQEVWNDVVALLERRFHVVTYDLRGAGGSTPPKDSRGYSLECLADDLACVIESMSPGRPVHLVGHDWGSISSWEAVTDARFRGRIASFTSISGPCLDHVGHWLRSRARTAQLSSVAAQALRSWYIGAAHLPVLPSIVWSFLADHWSQPHAPTLGRDGRRGVDLYRANIWPRLARPRALRTEVPVQLIVPLEDRYVARELYEGLEAWVERLWRREICAGHWVQRTHPAWVARAVTEFVDHVEGAPPSAGLRRAHSRRRGRGSEGKLVLVTGGGSGIGRATALAYAEQGAEVLVADLHPEAGARTARLASLLGPKAHSFQVDVADVKSMERFAAQVQATHGVVDILVNNAGIGMAGAFLDTRVEDWERILGVNLWGVLHGARLFGRQMVERAEGGHIVNVASAAAYLPSRALSAYATTKAAVLMLSECLRAELGESGVGVTALCPGVVDTGIVQTTRFVGLEAPVQEAFRARAKRAYRRRRFTPEQVAKALLAGVEANAPVVTPTAEAKFGRILSRLSPSLLRLLASQPVMPRGASSRGPKGPAGGLTR